MIINKELFFEDLDKLWKFAMKDSHAFNLSSRDRGNLKWYGNVTWEEAKLLAINGWKEGLNEVDKFRAEIIPIITNKVLRASQIYSVVGSSVDVGRFLSNDPECFIFREFEEKNYPGKIFRIVCSISFSWTVPAEVIIQRGAMICALVDAIEFAGHRAEVICNDASSFSSFEQHRKGLFKSSGWFEVSVVVKKANQPLEMSELAFCLAHPAMLRRIMFSVAELEGWSDFAHNYGSPAEATDKGDLYVREIFSSKVPNNEAIEWVINELEKLGVKIEMTN
jgi:hypothetical protein